ncbi:MAG: GntR family transcriptional regulator, N-acetylglucosamine utilization regulator [Pseudonocardiales bacterium]|nr:GntR family transcriptional regulator, N-acetylglucosamine utilization regulator [Pseudonocardiales bacterium]MDT7707842.1 GntR family transcriptional regulator, N-acetylglucosamine utilization regulator [Pseudonocardiales bacterium]
MAKIVEGMVPKHEQLRAILAELVSEHLSPGDLLPSERQLCVDHGVSRITVRDAIGQLVSEGLLVRVRGKGTFVAQRAARSRLHLASFHEDMRRLGLTPTTVVLVVERTVPPAATSHALAMRAGRQAWHVRRLLLADGSPMTVDDAWYNAELVPDLDAHDLSRSIYDTLRDHYGLLLDRAEQTVAAGEAGEEFAVLLGVPASRPALVVDRISFSGGKAVEHTRSVCRGDRYELQMSLDRSGSG